MTYPTNQEQNPFDTRTILAVVLCVVGFMAYQKLYLEPKYPTQPQQTQPSSETSTSDQGTTAAVGGTAATSATGSGATGTATDATVSTPTDAGTIQKLSPDQLVFETSTSRYIFSQEIGGLKSVVLKDYNDHKGPDAQPINILDSPMAVQGQTNKSLKAAIGAFNGERTGNNIKFWRQSGPWVITQTYTLPDSGYDLKLQVDFKNISNVVQPLQSSLLMSETLNLTEKSSGFLPGMPTQRPMLIYSSDADTEHEDLEGYCDDDDNSPIFQQQSSKLNFVGYDKHYFIQALQPVDGTYDLLMQKTGAPIANTCQVSTVLTQDQGNINPGESVTLNFNGFFGPKVLDVLNNSNPALEESVNLGFFGFIAKPLLHGIDFLYGFMGNYGLAIIVMTLALKIVFYPLMKTTAVSMHKMKKLNPQMQELREKYKDDKQKQQQELMKFMSQHKINPAKGCLPILPQIPVFFAFYQVLAQAIELRHAPFFGWITDLSASDPYFVTPVLWGLCMFVQQKLTPTTGMDKTQERIMQFFPLIFVGLMLSLPAGMMIYLLTNTITSIAQQKWLNAKMEKLAV